MFPFATQRNNGDNGFPKVLRIEVSVGYYEINAPARPCVGGAFKSGVCLHFGHHYFPSE
jgi:hypothetical protein